MMTQAAIYEARYYRHDRFAARYYKNDYIGLERLKTKIWMTVIFGIILAAYMFNLVYIEQVDFLHFDYSGFVTKTLIIYLLISFSISFITSAVYGPRYERASQRLEAYYEQLAKITAKERGDL